MHYRLLCLYCVVFTGIYYVASLSRPTLFLQCYSLLLYTLNDDDDLWSASKKLEPSFRNTTKPISSGISTIRQKSSARNWQLTNEFGKSVGRRGRMATLAATGCGRHDEAVMLQLLLCGQLIDYHTASVDCCCHHWWSIKLSVIFINEHNLRDLFFVKRLEVRTFRPMYRGRLQGNQHSSGLQFEVAYWPALAVGGAAQLAAAHCPNERTLDPQSAARQTHLCPS